ncbi:MAG: hypothetical protein NTY77_11815 [Elusimicrobia bacterium]|nr:hypothetical protein [Elusimicrobiota bacterium]
MTAAWLCLLPALSLSFAKAPAELEAPDQRPYAEATPELFARRGRACRADLEDYQSKATLELMDRLIVCMEHPDARLRAEVLDLLPDRRLWDRPDYDAKVAPELGQVYVRFQHDPDDKVRMHAGQLGMWLSNGRHWREYDSPQAQARRAAEERRPPRHPQIDGESQKLGDYALGATIVAVLLAGLIGRLFRVGLSRPRRR